MPQKIHMLTIWDFPDFNLAVRFNAKYNKKYPALFKSWIFCLMDLLDEVNLFQQDHLS